MAQKRGKRIICIADKGQHKLYASTVCYLTVNHQVKLDPYTPLILTGLTDPWGLTKILDKEKLTKEQWSALICLVLFFWVVSAILFIYLFLF